MFDDDTRGFNAGEIDLRHLMNSRCHCPDAAPHVTFQICLI